MPVKTPAPITAIESLVNDPADFNVNSVTFYDFVIYATQQIQDQALISHIRMGSVAPSKPALFRRETAIVISPCLGLVLQHLLPMPFLIHVATPTRVDFENG